MACRGRAATASSPRACGCRATRGTRRSGQAVDALLAGRLAEAARAARASPRGGPRAGDRNAELFAEMHVFGEAIISRGLGVGRNGPLSGAVAASPAAAAWRCSLHVAARGHGRTDEARAEAAAGRRGRLRALAFDANWPPAIGELAEACALLGDPGSAARCTSACCRTPTAPDRGPSREQHGISPAPPGQPRLRPRPPRRGPLPPRDRGPPEHGRGLHPVGRARPTGPRSPTFPCHGPVAQRLEQRTHNPSRGGSNPPRPI